MQPALVSRCVLPISFQWSYRPCCESGSGWIGIILPDPCRDWHSGSADPDPDLFLYLYPFKTKCKGKLPFSQNISINCLNTENFYTCASDTDEKDKTIYAGIAVIKENWIWKRHYLYVACTGYVSETCWLTTIVSAYSVPDTWEQLCNTYRKKRGFLMGVSSSDTDTEDEGAPRGKSAKKKYRKSSSSSSSPDTSSHSMNEAKEVIRW